MPTWVRFNDSTKRWQISTNNVDFTDLTENPLHEFLDVSGTASQSVSDSGKARIYFDSDDNRLKASMNGAAYTNLVVASDALLTTKGDLFGFSTVQARVPIGSNGTILTAASGETLGLKWGSGPLTTKGDIAVYGSVIDRLAIGTNGYVLTPASGESLGVKWWNPPYCSIRRSADKSINNATTTIVDFDAEDEDNDSMHDNVTNNSRITFTTAGLYLIGFTDTWSGDVDGQRSGWIFIDGAADAAAARLLVAMVPACTSASFQTSYGTSMLYRFTAGQYIEHRVHHTAGAAINWYAGDADSGGRMWARWVAP